MSATAACSRTAGDARLPAPAILPQHSMGVRGRSLTSGASPLASLPPRRVRRHRAAVTICSLLYADACPPLHTRERAAQALVLGALPAAGCVPGSSLLAGPDCSGLWSTGRLTHPLVPSWCRLCRRARGAGAGKLCARPAAAGGHAGALLSGAACRGCLVQGCQAAGWLPSTCRPATNGPLSCHHPAGARPLALRPPGAGPPAPGPHRPLEGGGRARSGQGGGGQGVQCGPAPVVAVARRRRLGVG